MAVQIIVTALLVVSEAVVEAYDERFGSRMAYETVADEFVRSQPAEGSVEGDDDQIVDPQPLCTPSYDPTVTAGCVKCGSASKP